MAQPDDLNKSDSSIYEVEGIGYDFVPTVCNREVCLSNIVCCLYKNVSTLQMWSVLLTALDAQCVYAYFLSVRRYVSAVIIKLRIYLLTCLKT